MIINNMQEEVRSLRNELDQARADARKMAQDPKTDTKALNDQADLIGRLDAELRLAVDALRTEEARQAKKASPVPEEDKGMKDMLKSNEYARAFAYAIRNGLNPNTARRHEECRVLLDALTESGNSGADGGFLVPIDIDNQIRELKRQMLPLSDLVAKESVSTLSGWRVKDTAPTAGFSSVDEMATIGSSGDQPVFGKVEYQLAKYGLIVPVSNELANDEAANLFAYLARWFAKKDVLTENGLILAALGDLEATNIAAGEELAGIKAALNIALDPEIAVGASLLMNQTGFNILDSLVDGTGRPLVHIDTTTATPRLVNGKEIHVISDAQLPNASGKAPFFVGDFEQYCTLFSRDPMEIVSTDIGGSAFRTDSIEVRGIRRMCVSKFDTDAAVKRNFVIGA